MKKVLFFIINCFWKIILIFSFIALGLDSYKNIATTERFFHINSDVIFLVALLFTFFVRHYEISNLSKKSMWFIGKIVFPISFLLGLGFTIWDYLTPPNFVFSLFLLNYQKIFLMAILSGWLWFWYRPLKWRKKNRSKTLFFSGFFLLGIALVISLWPFDYFIKISEEDNFIENSQVIVLFSGSLYAFLISRKLFLKSKRIVGLLFMLISAMLFFTGGEEINWGQRLFNLTTPSYFQASNIQNEISIHNLSSFAGKVSLMYMLVGLYGWLGWFVLSFLGPKVSKKLEIIVPKWYFFPYFYTGFIYNFRIMLGPHSIGKYSEFAELMLYMGVTLFIIDVYDSLKRKK